jgi:AcrR family transcriptional regulator
MDEVRVRLRERTRSAVRAQLADTAMDLFVRQGFEATTVEQIAAETGLSRRSFHRYFSGKEDVLREWFAGIGAGIADALFARPVDERPWPALRRAFDGVVEAMTTSPEARVITRMMLGSPALYGTHQQKVAQWRTLLADVLEQRLAHGGSPQGRTAALALASAALVSLECAQLQWISDDNTKPLAELVDEAMNAIAPTQ